MHRYLRLAGTLAALVLIPAQASAQVRCPTALPQSRAALEHLLRSVYADGVRAGQAREAGRLDTLLASLARSERREEELSHKLTRCENQARSHREARDRALDHANATDDRAAEPTNLYGLGEPLVADPELIRTAGRYARARVEADVATLGEAATQTGRVLGTTVSAQGQLLRSHGSALSAFGEGYVEAARGLGEERSLVGHVTHTAGSITGGQLEAARRAGSGVIEYHRTVGGAVLEGAGEVAGTWWDGTRRAAAELVN